MWRSRPSAAVRNCACVLFSPIDAILTWFDYVVGPPSIDPSIQQSVFFFSFHSPLAYFCFGYPITYCVNRKSNEDIVWHFISNCDLTLSVVNPILATLSVGEREGGGRGRVEVK